MKRLLLISNSQQYQSGYLDHCAEAIREFLGSVKTVLFVPYALNDLDGYAQKATERFKTLGFDLVSVHAPDDSLKAIARADAFFVGGSS